MNGESQLANAGSETRAARERAVSIDCLRGLVMILMALDHTRAFLSAARFAPLDLVHTLYPVCRAFAALKARRYDWWLSYL